MWCSSYKFLSSRCISVNHKWCVRYGESDVLITNVISTVFIERFVSFTLLNPFSPCSFLITLKTSENLWFSDVFEGDQKKTFGRKGLTFEILAQPFIRQFFKTDWFPLAHVQFLIYTCMMRASKVFRLLGIFLFYLLTRTLDNYIELF